MKKTTFLLTLLLFSLGLSAQKTDKLIKKVLYKNKALKPVLDRAAKYKVQILYTPIIEGEPGKTLAFRHAPKEYFYPASTIKLPAVLLSLEKLHQLNKAGLTIETPMRVNSTWESYPSASEDSTSETGEASVGHYAKKVLIVSDNDAFNRLYDFLGPKYFNETMASKRYKGFEANHRLSIYLPSTINQSKPAVAFGKSKKVPLVPAFAIPARMEVSQALSIYDEPASIDEYGSRKKSPILIGKGYYSNGELVNKPMDFSSKNHYPLLAQHETIKSVFFPNAVSASQHFDLGEDNLAFVKKYMSLLPRESDFPKYNPMDYYDGYAKFFNYGDTKARIPDHINIYNKIGQAYGFLIDNAYIEDTKHNVSFMLSAVIYVNKDGVLNDNQYEYVEVGVPFLAELGRTLLDYEIKKRGR